MNHFYDEFEHICRIHILYSSWPGSLQEDAECHFTEPTPNRAIKTRFPIP